MVFRTAQPRAGLRSGRVKLRCACWCWSLSRLAWILPTLLGLTLIVFAMSHVIPADPARVMAGENASPAQVEAVRVKLGLDQPLPQQFVRYVRDILSGDMGISLYTQRPVVGRPVDAAAGDLRADARGDHRCRSRSACRSAWSRRSIATPCSTRRCGSSPSRASPSRPSGWRSCCSSVQHEARHDAGAGPHRRLGPGPDHRLLSIDALLAATGGPAQRAAPPGAADLHARDSGRRDHRALHPRRRAQRASSNFVLYQGAMGLPPRRDLGNTSCATR